MPYSFQSKACLENRTGSLLAAVYPGFASTCLALLILFSATAQATPPPQTVEEGFGVPTAVVEEVASEIDVKAAADAELTTAQKIKALLAETPDESDYQTTERCISRRQVKRYEVLDSSLMLVHGRRGKVWVNQFPRKCIGLRRNMTLVQEVRGSQVCANDSFYARQEWERLDGIGLRGTNLGSVHCVFAPFEIVSVEQAKIIKQAAKNGAFR